jgi:small subunit ribosomal protein S8
MNDPISDLITRIKNACLAHAKSVSVPYSRMKEDILKVMKENGYIRSFETKAGKNGKDLEIALNDSKISHIKVVSSPGHRIYRKSKMIPKPLRGFGLVVISTPRGVLSGEKAVKSNVGGEIICEIW